MAENTKIDSKGRILLLKSDDASGLLYTETNLAIIRGKKVQLDSNLAISPGDTISIGRDQFIAMPPGPVYFKDFAERGAQIIQAWDASIIIGYCKISPRMNVLEAGAGSGALSYSILTALGNNGTLVTVEKEQKYIELAKKNLSSISDFNNWTLVNEDIATVKLDRKFDAVVLDIPEPWNSIENLSRYVRPGSIVSCYLPTFNQVEKTVLSLHKFGFYYLETFEIVKRNLLVRESAVRPDNNMIGHTAFLVFAVRLSGIVFD
ncbi:MAG: methyltransferase domain-containing protein [Thermoplasmatales archaeon]|nr:methyltransferase domain-containing protein [Thermoplasmatales archaeon]